MAQGKKGILQEFKEFALEGNVLELAIAFILGLYFKHPLGSPIVPLATAYETLVDFYINDRR